VRINWQISYDSNFGVNGGMILCVFFFSFFLPAFYHHMSMLVNLAFFCFKLQLRPTSILVYNSYCIVALFDGLAMLYDPE
jgi:hypothetical protein